MLCNKLAKCSCSILILFVSWKPVLISKRGNNTHTHKPVKTVTTPDSAEQYFLQKMDPDLQKLLWRTVRDLLPQISTRSQMRDRCSRQES